MIRLIAFIFTISSLLACVDNEAPRDATELSFSTDTLLFDTLFSSVGSFTKRLKVYNPSSVPVSIPRISLAGGSQSPYEIILNGDAGIAFNNVELLPKDSLQVLVSVTIDPMDQDLPFIVKDSIEFGLGAALGDVDLVSWGQDAYYFSDSILPCTTNWTAGRPYVIYNSVLVDTLCQLNIAAGTKIYSHPGSTIFIKGTLESIGSSTDPIIFSNDRLDEAYTNAPGQWEGIYFLEGSKSNLLEYTTIRNTVLGIRAGTPDDDDIPDIELRQVRIENASAYGILSFTSDIYAENLLINNCRLGGFAAIAGGNYTLLHSTIANFPVSFLFDGPALVLSDNLVLDNDELLEADLTAEIRNSVIWGLSDDEVLVSETGNNTVSIEFENSVLKTSLSFSDLNNILNENPEFVGPEEYDYLPLPESILIDGGKDLGIVVDLLGNIRSNPPDIGAVERQ